jgi:hypothetical protein
MRPDAWQRIFSTSGYKTRPPVRPSLPDNAPSLCNHAVKNKTTCEDQRCKADCEYEDPAVAFDVAEGLNEDEDRREEDKRPEVACE